ncbi:hypothetical protein J4410_07700 [Candidatus Woesearchaeota archaeon]|nr:hypothetical protein [Candidatus Woesearchaeota archaeon]
MIQRKKEEEYRLRELIRDEADLFEASLKRNYSWRISSEKIGRRRIIYEEELYQRLSADSERPNSSI